MPAAARDELRLRVSAVTVASNDEREFLDGPRDARAGCTGLDGAVEGP